MDEKLKRDIIKSYGSIEKFRVLQIDMLQRFFAWVKETKLPIFLNYGVFLGYVRENRILPWDNDIDTGILEDDIDKLLNINNQELLLKYKFDKIDILDKKYHIPDTKHNSEHFRVWNINSISKLDFIDVFVMKNSGDNTNNIYVKWWFQDSHLDKKYYEDLKWERFLNCDIQIPVDYNKTLIHQYNKEWMIPKVNGKVLKLDKEYRDRIDNRLAELKVFDNEFFKF